MKKYRKSIVNKVFYTILCIKSVFSCMLLGYKISLKTGPFYREVGCVNSILCIKHGMNGFMCEAAIDKTRRRRSAGAERTI